MLLDLCVKWSSKNRENNVALAHMAATLGYQGVAFEVTIDPARDCKGHKCPITLIDEDLIDRGASSCPHKGFACFDSLKDVNLAMHRNATAADRSRMRFLQVQYLFAAPSVVSCCTASMFSCLGTLYVKSAGQEQRSI
eukprot:GHVU01115064.1.p1 GENE.GHVU01115064.1~~GHVU01115064.1.p1  ORF type:complete len:138 (-),score=9.00 GHVU01115064.1:1163-1576(-)